MTSEQFGFGQKIQFEDIDRRIISPRAYANCALWLDASDSSTITISTGVSQWNDKSGNARHLTQGTGANQPTVTAAGLNSRDFITFDGTNDELSNTGWTGQATPMTAVGVARLRANDAFGTYLGFLGDGALGTTISFDASAGGATYRLVGGAVLSGGAATNNVWYYFTVQWNTTSSFARANGASIVSTGDAGSATAGTFRLGAYAAAGVWFPLDVAEIVWYSRALAASEYQSLEAYLKGKWGL